MMRARRLTKDERRDSPRIAIALRVRYHDTFHQTEGTVSLGGVDFVHPHKAPAKFEVVVPTGRRPIHATVVPIIDKPERGHRRISASFTGLDLHTELKLARWLHRLERNKPPTL